MSQKWDAVTHEDILIAMLDALGSPSSAQWTSIMDALREKGYNFTISALRQHLAKLRKKAPATGGGDKAPAASNTKKPRGPAKAGNKRKAAEEDADAAGNDDGDEETPAPAPKKRVRKPKAEAKVKTEDAPPSYTAWQPVPPGLDMSAEDYNALAPNPDGEA